MWFCSAYVIYKRGRIVQHGGPRVADRAFVVTVLPYRAADSVAEFKLSVQTDVKSPRYRCSVLSKDCSVNEREELSRGSWHDTEQFDNHSQCCMHNTKASTSPKRTRPSVVKHAITESSRCLLAPLMIHTIWHSSRRIQYSPCMTSLADRLQWLDGVHPILRSVCERESLLLRLQLTFCLLSCRTDVYRPRELSRWDDRVRDGRSRNCGSIPG